MNVKNLANSEIPNFNDQVRDHAEIQVERDGNNQLLLTQRYYPWAVTQVPAEATVNDEILAVITGLVDPRRTHISGADRTVVFNVSDVAEALGITDTAVRDGVASLVSSEALTVPNASDYYLGNVQTNPQAWDYHAEDHQPPILTNRNRLIVKVPA